MRSASRFPSIEAHLNARTSHPSAGGNSAVIFLETINYSLLCDECKVGCVPEERTRLSAVKSLGILL
ncbi:hypothetical protein [Kamptonema formosum]|uniref:hypothetical protein n=1 Tax=Kamptonema formosum TaxID=331992 RepID=UPI0003458080|nr:hypothetical protein [Oscillatoria sp. PCC 10802]